MKSTAIVCAIAAASMSFASLSFAQGYDRPDRDGRPPHAQPQRPGNQGWDGRQAPANPRGPGPQYNQQDARNFDRQHQGYDRQYGARGPQFHRGGRIPQEYRNRQYVVNDWRGHRLNAPPRGYQWVQVGADYVLIAVATGLIAQLILSQ